MRGRPSGPAPVSTEPTPTAWPRGKRAFVLALGAVILLSHAYAIYSFGATFWIDSLAYVSLGQSLTSLSGLREYYQGAGRWLYSQVQPGLSVLWVGLSRLPDSLQWPLWASFQHLLASAALFSTSLGAYRTTASRLALVPCGVLCALPFYQAFHNSFMTESLSASLLLLGFGAAQGLLTKEKFGTGAFVGLLAAMVAVVQFRSYLGFILAFYGAVVLWRHKLLLSRHTVWLAAAFVVAILTFPVYRFALTGQFFLPEGGTNQILSALRANPAPSSRVADNLRSIPFPPDLTSDAILEKGLDYDGTIRLGEFWQSRGLSNREIDRLSASISRIVLRDQLWVTARNRAVWGLASCGLTIPYRILPADAIPFRGMTARVLLAHELENYRWFSWLAYSSYEPHFAAYFKSPTFDVPFSVEAQQWLCGTWQGYLSSGDVGIRDPLRIGSLPPDVWAIAGIVSGAFLLVVRRELGLLVLGTIVINFLVTAGFPLRNVRYAYPLIPLYFLAAALALGTLRRPTSPAEKGPGGDLPERTVP